MSLFGPKFNSFMERANNWMTPERAIAMQGIGQGLSQMSMGQAPNLSPAYGALMKRQQNAQMRETLQGSGIMERFTPEQQQLLAQMEPSAAQKIIAQALFAPAPAPTKGVEINGQLVNPVTGELMGDYRDPEEPGPTGYIATGPAAEALGLNPENAYNISVDGGVMKATQIGGGGTTVNVNNGSEVGTIPPGFELFTDPTTGARSMRPIAGGPAEAEQAAAEKSANQQMQLLIDESTSALELIQSVKDDPALASITGTLQGRLPAGVPGLTGGQAGANLEPKLLQLQGKAFLQAFESLKGGGQITQIEGQKATDAIARLQRTQDVETMIEALTDLEEVILAGLRRARAGESVTDDDPLGLR